MSMIACSATELELEPGACTTATPSSVAAGRSTMSRPTPCRPTTLSLGHAAILARLQSGLARNRMPSASFAAAIMPASVSALVTTTWASASNCFIPSGWMGPPSTTSGFIPGSPSGDRLTATARIIAERPYRVITTPRARRPGARAGQVAAIIPLAWPRPWHGPCPDDGHARVHHAGRSEANRRHLHRLRSLQARDADRLRRGLPAGRDRTGRRAARPRGRPGRPPLRGAGRPATRRGAFGGWAGPPATLRHERGQAFQVDEGQERRQAAHPRQAQPEGDRGLPPLAPAGAVVDPPGGRGVPGGDRRERGPPEARHDQREPGTRPRVPRRLSHARDRPSLGDPQDPGSQGSGSRAGPLRPRSAASRYHPSLAVETTR